MVNKGGGFNNGGRRVRERGVKIKDGGLKEQMGREA